MLEILQIVKEATADVLVVSVTYSRPAAVDELADAAGSLGIAVLVGRPGSTLTNLVTDARRVSPAMAR